MTDPRDKSVFELFEAMHRLCFTDDHGHPLYKFDVWVELRRRVLASGPLNSLYTMVERFNLDLIGIEPPSTPTILSFERGEFRLAHLREEMNEIELALSGEDFEDTVDGFLDLVYVALGAIVEMGVPAGAAFEEVHMANMAKMRGTKSTRPDSKGFDAIKPEGWKPPDLRPYLTLKRDEVLYMADHVEIALTYTGEEVADEELEAAAAMAKRPKILILGHSRHGKDTVADRLMSQYGMQFTSSSLFCAERVMLPWFQQSDIIYNTAAECFEDRHNHRAEWYKAICDFNRPDAAALGRAIFRDNDIYCGLRSAAEFNALKNSGVFDVAIWVDRSEHCKPEDESSCTVEPWMADFVLDNNSTYDELYLNINQLMLTLLS